MELLNKFPEFLSNHLQYVDSMVYTSLGNIGMLLHCAPTLMNVGCIESERVSFKYYFDGISPTIASFIEKMDKERLYVSSLLGYKLESVIDWVNRTYDSHGISLYESLQNNKKYREIDAPDSVHHRYIFEDIPCGLVPLEGLASLLRIQIPYTSVVIDLANKLMECDFRDQGRKINSEMLSLLRIK